MRIHAILSAVVGLVVVAGGLVAPATAAERIEQEYFWKWSDGSHASSRTFTETRYRSQRGLPNLVVTAVPAQPRHDVYLQFRQGGRWVLENRIRLDGSGTARVEINPYCENDAWCNGTFQYRVKVTDSYANLTITYEGRQPRAKTASHEPSGLASAEWAEGPFSEDAVRRLPIWGCARPKRRPADAALAEWIRSTCRPTQLCGRLVLSALSGLDQAWLSRMP